MKTAVAEREDHHAIARHLPLVAVVYKRKRVVGHVPNESSSLSFHTFKCHGGVLNPNAVHGQGHYIRRITGQDVGAVQALLVAIVKGQKEHV